MELNNTLENTFRGKSIFLTGHTGFKGSWLCIWLQMLGANMKGYSLSPVNPSLYGLIEKKLSIESIIADIRDRQNLEQEILSFRPDFIFHLAAQPLVFESYRFPVETFDTNVMGTVHVLNAVRKLDYKCTVVVITTDKVYQNKGVDTPYKESDPLGDVDPYSASKAAAEIAIKSYRLSFFNPEKYSQHQKGIASARSGNVIGGGDFAKDRIIPDYIRAIEKNETLRVRNPKSIRPWQHVLEALSGYLQLGKMLDEQPAKFSSSFNFGPEQDDVLTVEELVIESMKVFENGNYEIEKNNSPLHEANLLKLDISKAKTQLNWKPKYSSKSAVALTMQWYKKVLIEKHDAFESCENDILCFTNRLKEVNERP